ncbi:8-amino-7-oxononanoate synthase isoform X2 [Telopea speciosissima]|uniref:8-amino-7-oxononanoate synthase isoform X2 n=1 Tax=Telopea speciosissima TaxID=54955 RepID=UPI001CC6E953|nr:8-amino-7-oxononanoate synthase isoform X2 [Telopea speciosissima]
MLTNSWDYWVEEALSRLESLKVLRSLRPISLPRLELKPFENEVKKFVDSEEFQTFDGLRSWDRASVEVEIAEPTFQKWIDDVPSSGDEVISRDDNVDVHPGASPQRSKKLLLFSGNDYLGLSSHPTVRKAAAKAAQEHGMGPRGSALICGYTNYHRLLESCLADLKKKEDCLLCPTGFAANMAVMVTIGSVGSLLASGRKPLKDERVAIFSDALNHASIIDGIRLAERQGGVEVFVYRHCDMSHLDALLSSCLIKKKVVVSDSLFSMDGDFAPMVKLAELRKRHGFLLVLDDAHGSLVCGENGGGVTEEFNCESDVDICIGTLSKAAGCHGGFVTCSKKWKHLLQSKGRSFIFSTASPVPVVAAAHAAVIVAKKEKWRRKAIWSRVQDFRTLTGLPITSPIISLIVGSEEKALHASRSMLKYGFHVTAIRPPTVPPNSCRLRVTLSAAHTTDDLKQFTAALSHCISLPKIYATKFDGHARL